MEKVLKAEEVLEQLVLAMQEFPTAEGLNKFWFKANRILDSEVARQEIRLRTWN